MFTVSEAAQAQLIEYFKENELKPVRVFLANGCGGSHLTMALDEKRPMDAVYSFEGFEFVIEQALLDTAQPMEIDFGGQGFTISSQLQLGSGCGGCGSSDHCCS
jgi:Fe-S cluster assembly iron-binding protein IscA